ncbi:MAG: ATPase, partial [Parasporobacterium sp.]|nr:ATPase [Parasporobacterium sp.]
AMLQFLQGKSFGNQKVPEGWIIVAAGNPAEYNRSVREFDVVTLDRGKLVDVEADYGVWKEYAYQVGIHESIIAYLDIHRENFYRMESSVDGRQFVTARGWEDLSELIYAYERLGLKADREVVCQYLHHPVVAKDYANYLSLYYRYRTDYQVDEILQGVIRPGTLNKLKFAPFDERIQVVSLLLDRLSDTFRETFDQDEDVKALYALVTEFLEDEKSADKEKLAQLFAREEEAREKRMAAGQNVKQLRRRGRYMEDMARRMMDALSAPQTDALSASQTDARSASQTDALNASRMDARTAIRPVFMQESEKRDEMAAKAMQQLEFAFDFMEKAFGQSQEMVVFITELSINRYAAWFLKENDCPRYYQYNKNLLFDDRQVQTLARIDSLKKQRIAEDLTLTGPEESDPESE